MSLSWATRTIALLLCVVLLIGCFPIASFATEMDEQSNTTEFAGGTGTEADPYLIKTKKHLNNVRNYLNAHYKMIDNIEFLDEDFSEGGDFYNDGSGFLPIGTKDDVFCGSFDADGYTIRNLVIYSSTTADDAYAGLFAVNNGVIKNLGVENGNISVYPESNQYSYCGSIAGKNLGVITDCYSTGHVWSRRYAGGIAGCNSGTIRGCYNNCVVTASKEFDLSAGGIVGYNYDGIISSCYNNGQISASANVTSTFSTTYYAFAGGIVGYGYAGLVEKCYNICAVNAESNVIITENSDAYASAKAGGIVGSNRGCNIDQCYNIGVISADTTASGHWYDIANSYAGGIAGSNGSKITSCYNVGIVTTSSATDHNYPGGIAGSNSGSISTSYNVADSIENIASSNSGTIKNSYFHSETLPDGNKLASLFSVLTYQGFDFESVWEMSDDNYPLPVLREVKNCAIFEYSPEENTVDFASGKGTDADPFVIKTITQLNNIIKYPTSYFILANDLNFDSESEAFASGWIPFAFKGNFDGQGHKITNIRITVSNTLEHQWRDPGLFSRNDGIIENLTVENMWISVNNVGSKYGGFICATNNGTIRNCHSYNCAIVLGNASHYFGGIVGNNTGTIQNCISDNVINWDNVGGRVGGVASDNSGLIVGCSNYTPIINVGYYTPTSGGISGQNNGKISFSKNLADVSTSSVNSQVNSYSGGLVGQMLGGEISQCYNTGKITTVATAYKGNTYSGGIVAYINGGKIENCYNIADIYGESGSFSAYSYVGGIVGYNKSSESIRNCYSIGENSGYAYSINLYVGYICGFNASNSIVDCYYLGVPNNGSGSGDSSQIYGESAAALQNQATYTCFDFDTIWTMDGGDNYLYAELINNELHFVVQSIEIQSEPSKKEYIEFTDKLDVSDGYILVRYNTGTTALVSISNDMISGFDNTVVGTQTLTVNYKGQTCTYDVTVNHAGYSGVVTHPTCTERGYTTYTCSCGDSYIDAHVDELGHKWTDATCTTPKTCKVCGAIEGSTLPHTEVTDAAVAATCTATGKTEGKHCSVCNTVTVAQQTVPKKAHTEVKDAAVAATCTAAGKTEGKHCSVCGTVTVAQQTVPAKGHTEVMDKAVAATCTATGKTEGKHCSVCNTIIVAQKNIPATGHTYDNGVDGTCNGCGIHREETEDRTVMHMFRMYDPNSGEHFYTGSVEERENLVAVGWNYEGVGFTFSRTTGLPVYRLYDPATGEHLYTMSEEEKAALMAQGWNFEGIAFNSAYDTEVPQYRLHNPNATRGAYHFTASIEERDFLISIGWEDQGIGFYSSWK